MPIQITKNEEWSVEIDGTTFKGRYLSGGENLKLIAEHTHLGKLDEQAYQRARWERCLTGWGELYGENGNQIPFSASSAADIGEALSVSLQNILNNKILGTVFVAKEALGNSSGS